MKKKWLDVIFIGIFMAMLFVPLLFLDTTPDLISEQENRAMTKWPGWGFDKEINESYGHYFEDRIGFRKQAVRAYTKLCYGVFGEFSETLHMFGKEGYVFPADKDYVQAYQRLHTDEKLIQDFVTYLKNTNEYLKGKGIPFVFLAGLDKKTVYPEYMPDSIRVKADNESIMESLARQLDEAGVPYVIPIEEYREAKKTQQIYNKMYDCAHWNDLGELIGIRLADEKLNEQGLGVPAVEEGDYNLTYELRNQLEFVEISIEEQVPVYQLKEQPELWDDGDLTTNMYLMAGTGMGFYGNSNAGTKKRILIFHDSFLQDSVEFYYTRYSQVFMTNRQNYEHLQYYVNLLQPDAVIFENAERAFVDDLYAYTNLSNVEYEPSYTSFQSLQKAEESGNKILRESEFAVEITEAENATYEGNVVSLDSDRTYYNLRGEIQIPSYLVQSHSRLHLYAKYKKKYYEINYSASESGYEALRSDCPGVSKKQVGEPSNQLEFYISLRRQKEMKGKMKLVLVDEEKNVEYQVGTLSLKFADQ